MLNIGNVIGDEWFMYLPLAYVKRYSELTDWYCSEERSDCTPEELLEMISDPNWGSSNYSGIKKDTYLSVYNAFNQNYFGMHTVSACYAVAGFVGIWKYNKIVYEPDYEFSQELLRTNKLRVYPDMLKHLPFNTFYLDFSKNNLFCYEGFFVNVKVYATGRIKIASLPTEIGYSHIPLHEFTQKPDVYADAFFIEPEMLHLDNGMQYYDFNLNRDMFYTVDSYKTQWFVGGLSNFRLFLLQFLMYLSSEEPDVIENPETAKIYRPSNVIRNKYSEIQKWDVGCHYGEKIRGFQQLKRRQEAGSFEINKEKKVKRPHIRKAHWQQYHVGKGRKKIIQKWKAPTFINGNNEEIISTIHVVTNREPECSSGEDFIKQYLKSKGIKFSKEHYVREIGRRYDFSFFIENSLVFVEFDGEQHFKTVNRWGGRKAYIKRHQADIEKNKYCLENNIPLLQIRFDQKYLISEMIDDFLTNYKEYHNQFNPYLSKEAYYSVCE